MTVPTVTAPPVPGCLVITEDPSACTSAIGKPDPLAVRHLLEEGIVAAAALGAALNDMTRHDRAGDGVEVGVGPPEGVQGRPDDQRGVGDPARHHHPRPGGQRIGDRAGAQVRIGRDDPGLGGERLAGVEVDERLAGGAAAPPTAA